MGLFSKKTSETESYSNELNAFLGAGTEYRGKLDFVGTVRIDGDFEGEISTDGTLILGKDATIRGVVRVGSLSSCGAVTGDIMVRDKAVLHKNSTTSGSLQAKKLTVEEGAVIEGSIAMGTATMEPQKVVTGDFGPDRINEAEAVEATESKVS